MYSFIIITHNEQEKIRSVIESIQAAGNGFQYEIIVSDGGSTDNTLNILKTLKVKIIHSDSGRGIQLRRGVKEAKGHIYIFLHGDTLFPADGLRIIKKFYSENGVQASTFRMGFDQSNVIYNLYRWFTSFDSVFSSFGDQCITVTKELYEKTGGFPAWQIFEDVAFLRKIRKETKIVSLPSEVVTSTRRFEQNGIIKQQLKNFLLIIGFYLGIKHRTLSRIYENKKKATKSAVVLFTRFPIAGKVKTRLAESIGATKAAEFYKTCCEHCFNTVAELASISKYIYSAEPNQTEEIENWAGNAFLIRKQSDGDLGNKMYNAAKELKKEKYNKIIILGTDIPDISNLIIKRAFKELDKADFVLGPSYDGGYYLIGVNNINFEVFDAINWSTNKVLEQTLDKINKMGCSYFLLEHLTDIDFKDDLSKWYYESKNKNHPVKNWVREAEIL